MQADPEQHEPEQPGPAQPGPAADDARRLVRDPGCCANDYGEALDPLLDHLTDLTNRTGRNRGPLRHALELISQVLCELREGIASNVKSITVLETSVADLEKSVDSLGGAHAVLALEVEDLAGERASEQAVLVRRLDGIIDEALQSTREFAEQGPPVGGAADGPADKVSDESDDGASSGTATELASDADISEEDDAVSGAVGGADEVAGGDDQEALVELISLAFRALVARLSSGGDRPLLDKVRSAAKTAMRLESGATGVATDGDGCGDDDAAGAAGDAGDDCGGVDAADVAGDAGAGVDVGADDAGGGADAGVDVGAASDAGVDVDVGAAAGDAVDGADDDADTVGCADATPGAATNEVAAADADADADALVVSSAEAAGPDRPTGVPLETILEEGACSDSGATEATVAALPGETASTATDDTAAESAFAAGDDALQNLKTTRPAPERSRAQSNPEKDYGNAPAAQSMTLATERRDTAPIGGYLSTKGCKDCAKLEARWNKDHPTLETNDMTVRRRPPPSKVTCKNCRSPKRAIRAGIKASRARRKQAQKEAKRRTKVARAQTRTEWAASEQALRRRNSKPAICEMRDQLKGELEKTERAASADPKKPSSPSKPPPGPAAAVARRERRQSLYSVTINL